jgi:metal-sulfur cluster biosynthetic enzyme
VQSDVPADPSSGAREDATASGNGVPSVEEVLEALRLVDDPEVGINIVDLGLVYRVETAPQRVIVELTLTSPACPLGDYISDNARRVIAAIAPEGVAVDIELVWEPFWTPDKMSEFARQTLGWTG